MPDKVRQTLRSPYIRTDTTCARFVYTICSSVRRLKQSIRGRTLAGARGIITPLLLRVKTSAGQRDTLCNHKENGYSFCTSQIPPHAPLLCSG